MSAAATAFIPAVCKKPSAGTSAATAYTPPTAAAGSTRRIGAGAPARRALPSSSRKLSPALSANTRSAYTVMPAPPFVSQDKVYAAGAEKAVAIPVRAAAFARLIFSRFARCLPAEQKCAML